MRGSATNQSRGAGGSRQQGHRLRLPTSYITGVTLQVDGGWVRSLL